MKYSLEALQAETQRTKDPVWVGFDLDGTLATYDKWRGWDHVGEPVPAMILLVKTLLMKKIDCRILTARASKVSLARNNLQLAQMEKVIQDWTEKHIGVRLPVMTEKDCYLLALVDDKAVQVEMNTGKIIGKDIIMTELAKNNLQTDTTKPVEVEPATIDQQRDWNQQAVAQSKIDELMAGMVAGGFTSADLPSDWRGSQWLINAMNNNTIVRVAINSMKGNVNGVEGWYLVCDVYVAAGSNRVAFVLDAVTPFAAIGKILAQRTVTNVGVSM